MDSMTEDIGDTFGALLIGSFISVILYGLGVHQFYRYMRLYSTDATSIRLVVYALILLATAETAITIHANYYYLVTNYFNPNILTEAVWSVNVLPVVSVLVTVLAQLFFARRVFLIGPKYRIPAVAAIIFLIARLTAEIALAVRGFRSRAAKAFLDDQWTVALTTTSSTAVDLVLAASIISAFWYGRKNQKGDETRFAVFVMYTVNTGLMILLFDFLSLVFAFAKQGTLYWVVFNNLGTRVALNTLFCILNTRKLSAGGAMEIFNSGTSGTLQGSNIIARANRMATVERWNVPQDPDNVPPSMIDIKVTREIEGAESIEMSEPGDRQSRKDRSVIDV